MTVKSFYFGDRIYASLEDAEKAGREFDASLIELDECLENGFKEVYRNDTCLVLWKPDEAKYREKMKLLFGDEFRK